MQTQTTLVVMLGILLLFCIGGALAIRFETMRHERLRDQVHESLTSARANGHFVRGGYLWGMSPEEIADDLVQYDADLEGRNPEDLVEHVRNWLKTQGVAR